MFNEYISFLKERFKEKLPGEEAHMRMAPLGRKTLNYYLSLNIEYRNGSVLGHLYPINNEPHLLFIKRSDDGKTHSGQIAFPGGKQDVTDFDLQETALREAFEEVGLIPVAAIPQLSAFNIIGNYCIGTEGEIASVALFSEVPMHEIKKVLLDYQSRSSVALLKWLMKEYWGIDPEIVEAKDESYRKEIKGTACIQCCGKVFT